MSTPADPVVNFLVCFVRGQHYAKTWPMEKRLAPMFIENRAIRATRRGRFASCRYFTLCWQIALGGQLGPAIGDSAFYVEPADARAVVVGKRSITLSAAFYFTLVL